MGREKIVATFANALVTFGTSGELFVLSAVSDFELVRHDSEWELDNIDQGDREPRVFLAVLEQGRGHRLSYVLYLLGTLDDKVLGNRDYSAIEAGLLHSVVFSTVVEGYKEVVAEDKRILGRDFLGGGRCVAHSGTTLYPNFATVKLDLVSFQHLRP